MLRRMLTVAIVIASMAAGALPASAADPIAEWGDEGVATVPVPEEATATAAATTPDNRLVVVGGDPGGGPWGVIISADGDSSVLLTGAPDIGSDSYDAVAVAPNRILAVGTVDAGFNEAGFVHVFDLDGTYLSSGVISVSEDTIPTSVVADGSGTVYVAGSASGDDDGSAPGWVVRLRSNGTVDASFGPVLLTNPAETVDSIAFVGASRGSAVAVVWGEDDPSPGSAVGFHAIDDGGASFMADFYTSTDILEVDIDSSSGMAVFGAIAEGGLTSDDYSVLTIGENGSTMTTAVGTWVDVAGKIEVGRLRTGELLAAGEGDENIVVQLVESSSEFAGLPDAELVDLTTSLVDGSVFLTANDATADEVVVIKYHGDTSGRFLDDDDSVHEADIETLDGRGVARGCNPPLNDMFCPTDNLTRGQMAAFLARALELPGGAPDAFIDDNGSEFEADIDAIAAAEITLGCNPPINDFYCATELVTRGQMAAFLARAFDLPESAADTFTDDDGSVFEADIEAIAAAGITLGCNPPANDLYCPDDPVTREQMASFLVRADP